MATKTKGTRWTRTLRRRLDEALSLNDWLEARVDDLESQLAVAVPAPADDPVEYAAWAAAAVAVMWTPETVAELVPEADRAYVRHHCTWNIFEVRGDDFERCVIPIRDALTRPVAQAIYDVEGGARCPAEQWAAAQELIRTQMALQ